MTTAAHVNRAEPTLPLPVRANGRVAAGIVAAGAVIAFMVGWQIAPENDVRSDQPEQRQFECVYATESQCEVYVSHDSGTWWVVTWMGSTPAEVGGGDYWRWERISASQAADLLGHPTRAP